MGVAGVSGRVLVGGHSPVAELNDDRRRAADVRVQSQGA